MGPADDENRTVNLGVASHIAAASPGGPRYDAAMSPADRKAASNGIWLCQNCGKLIDSDVKGHPVELLREWKKTATQRAFAALARGQALPCSTKVPEDEADLQFTSTLSLPAADDLESVVRRILPAAAADIATFRRTRSWPECVLQLQFTLESSGDHRPVTISGLAASVQATSNLAVVGPPGIGKTTTLVQLCDSIIAQGHSVPVLVPLGEWSDRPEGILRHLTHRSAFLGFSAQHFMQLAYAGRLVLLLDGWNELAPEARLRAIRELDTLRREFPMLCMVAGTRTDLFVADSPVVHIEALSEDQQLELARMYRGDDGAALLDQAWRTKGLRELVATPLYLSALLKTTPGSALPQTKEEVLRTFVQQHVSLPERAELLEQELHGFHDDFLGQLGAKANRIASTLIPAAEARRAFVDAGRKLVSQGQLVNAIEPSRVLKVLVGVHLLVQSAGAVDGVQFQHHQFQEWYAAQFVEQLMMKSAAGDQAALATFRKEVLDRPAWEESILFACERASRSGPTGADAVARTVLLALNIDPMLAAQMIYRSSMAAWLLMRDQVHQFAVNWHSSGKVDRGVRFMIVTGKSEFAPFVWPLIASDVQYVRVDTMRVAPRFRPSVLGDAVAQQLSRLPDDKRDDIVTLIAQESGFDGMELATSIALTDPNPQIVAEVLQALVFRRADRQVAQILANASDTVWAQVGLSLRPEDLEDPAHAARVRAEKNHQAEESSDPIRKLWRLVESGESDASSREEYLQLLQSTELKWNDQRIYDLLRRGSETYPQETARAFWVQAQRGTQPPAEVAKTLSLYDSFDEDGAIADSVLGSPHTAKFADIASALASTRSILKILDAMLAHEQEGGHKLHVLLALVAGSRDRSFFTALLSRAHTVTAKQAGLLADLLVRRQEGGRTRRDIPAEIKAPLVFALKRWVDLLLSEAMPNRSQLATLAQAAGTLGDPQLLPDIERLLQRDQAELDVQRKLHPTRGTTSFEQLYRLAFVLIGTTDAQSTLARWLPDLQMGEMAAQGLVEIWQRSQAGPEDSWPGIRHKFSRARDLWRQRALTGSVPPTCDSAEAIFQVVRRFRTSPSSDDAQRHAIKLAVAGLVLPHGDKSAEVASLLTLPQPRAFKLKLLNAMARVGMTLPSAHLEAALAQLLEEAVSQQWRLEEIRDWIELFPFSDRPIAVVDIMITLQGRPVSPGLMDSLLQALGQTPSADALLVLEALAILWPKLATNHYWREALLQIRSEPAALLLLKVIAEAAAGDSPPTWMEARRASQELSKLVQALPAFGKLLHEEYEKASPGAVKTILEQALAENPTEEIALAFVRSYGKDARHYGGALENVLTELAVGRRNIEGQSGWYEEFSAPLPEFRRALFAMTTGDNSIASVASACLDHIERLRDKHGRLMEETRHPDIDADGVWPVPCGSY